MSVTVVGSVALDTIETPWGSCSEALGGSATFFSLAAAHYTRVHLIGVVGEDFADEHVALLRDRTVDVDGLERVAGKTFRWTGRYHEDVNRRDTLDTQTNVFDAFHPKLTEAARNAPYLFLGNIQPSLQMEVLDNTAAKFVALDTMNLYIDTALDELKAVLKRVDAVVINDSEVRELTGHPNVIKGARALADIGPRIVVVKKGEHGGLLFEGEHVFAATAVPMADVVDPTGAGDAFAGGFMGYLARQDATDSKTLRQAMVHGTVVASFACESFGPGRLAEIGDEDIEARYQTIRDLVAF